MFVAVEVEVGWQALVWGASLRPGGEAARIASRLMGLGWLDGGLEHMI